MVMFIESTKQCDDDEFAQRHFYLKDTKKPSLFNLGFTDPVTGYSSQNSFGKNRSKIINTNGFQRYVYLFGWRFDRAV